MEVQEGYAASLDQLLSARRNFTGLFKGLFLINVMRVESRDSSEDCRAGRS